MGTDDINPREFGEMVANVRTLLVNQAQIKLDLTEHEKNVKKDLQIHQEAVQLHLFNSNQRLFDKIEGIGKDMNALMVSVASIEPVIKVHGDEITALKSRPERIVTIGCAVIAAIGGALAFWKGH